MKLIAVFLLVFAVSFVHAQTSAVDSTQKLNEVIIKGYFNPQTLLRTPATVNLLDSNQFQNQPRASLVSLANTVPGLRMEERSPGSYRLSLRGSLLRSPFGIRNVKIYLADFPLTDAGGNTYLNLIDLVGIGNLEIYKGPEASTFGANTGGALLINPLLKAKNEIELGVDAGSYGLFHQTASIDRVYPNYRFNITEGYQRSDGYRQNSALQRKYIQTTQQWDYSLKGQLKAFVFFSDLNYETPGGLTAQQLASNRRLARPATPSLPGAVSQQAGIYNQSIFGGLANQYQINSHFKHVIAVFGSYTDFKNPFITNFEKRKESTFGLRTFMQFETASTHFSYHVQAGVEMANTNSDIRNFNNDRGTATALQAADDLHAGQRFAFLRMNFDVNQRWLIELGSSLNFFSYSYRSNFPINIDKRKRSFDPQWMPKIASSFLVNANLSLRASVSKGYSPPTLAEVRSSDNIINNNLQAEAGWNYEAGLRWKTSDQHFYVDANIYEFLLKDAIVRRLNTNDVEYFINAGGTKQRGIELIASWSIISNNTTNFISNLQLNSAYTYAHYRFVNFKNANQDYSGNRLTGIPSHVWYNSLELGLKRHFFFFVQQSYNASLPLNDANTFYAKNYYLTDIKIGAKNLRLSHKLLNVNFGINNLFNRNYSLGNDLNAASNRFYNPAPGVNYYAGLSLKL
ncbi:TonB-dependent receptor [Pedobacter sp. KR3-3]|uniref:TonB-dependent receptor n=1 Tax=Pedobacter albus TaxID=3113905 RepID=A0ABU7I8B6_9SPHI|nr:TonB-dependent receptor [Pedobacter sp. KR3-3]MEE1945607.1 TonB-dependent receptor [Pedobacter sp. KR3-3]